MFERIKRLFKKQICLYLVYKNDNSNTLVTILSEMSELGEFINRSIIATNFAHYKAWCKLRGLDYQDPAAEENYVINFLDSAEEETLNKYTYMVKKATYPKKTVASILRMFNECIPLGCSYESEMEQLYGNLLYESLQKMIEDKQENVADAVAK